MFRKKYKMKKRRKTINPYVIFITFAATLLLVSYAYSLLSDSLFVKIKANILSQESSEMGKSTYYWKLTNNPWSGTQDDSQIYQIEFYINNLDGDTTSWEFEFDMPDGFVSTGNNTFFQASNISTSGNTITITSSSWSGYIQDNATFTLYTQMEFTGDPGIKNTTEPDKIFGNFKFNGKTIKYKDPNSSTPEDNTTDNSVVNNTTNETTNEITNDTNNSTTNNNATENNTTNNTTNTTTNNTTGGNTIPTPPSSAEDGLSTYTWKYTGYWGGGSGYDYTYAANLSIVNLDDDYDYAEISFDVPEGFLVESSGNCNIWQADTVSQNGNTITIKFRDNTVSLKKGDTLDLYLQLHFESEVDFYITNLVFNGKKASLNN